MTFEYLIQNQKKNKLAEKKQKNCSGLRLGDKNTIIILKEFFKT